MSTSSPTSLLIQQELYATQLDPEVIDVDSINHWYCENEILSWCVWPSCASVDITWDAVMRVET